MLLPLLVATIRVMVVQFGPVCLLCFIIYLCILINTLISIFKIIIFLFIYLLDVKVGSRPCAVCGGEGQEGSSRERREGEEELE